MKIVKTASGKQTIKMSKSEWTDIGKKAGWMKEAMSEPISLSSHLSQIEDGLRNINGQDFIDLISSFIGPNITNKIIERIKQESSNPKKQVVEPDFKNALNPRE